jgi:tRNA-dihydrouridine synthase A
MLDWTDRHCRRLHRIISPRARLYTEMVTTGALLHGDPHRHLDHDAAEHPLALQLGGSETADLAACARMALDWGYDEINLNCGCPSERVQRGAFGACLMAEPQLVADGVRAMLDATGLPVTVKHRIGLGREESFGFVRDFVGTVAQAGCRVFIVHTRNAWLQGLSPRENREVPPLRPEVIGRLRADFPDCHFVRNGGLATGEAAAAALQDGADGVMIGRVAYQQPMTLAAMEAALWPLPPDTEAETPARPDALTVVQALQPYVEAQHARGVPPWAIARHCLGLFHGLPGARRWRRQLSDPAFVKAAGTQCMLRAAEVIQGGAEER